MLINQHTNQAFFPPVHKQYSEAFLRNHREVLVARPIEKGLTMFQIGERARMKK